MGMRKIDSGMIDMTRIIEEIDKKIEDATSSSMKVETEEFIATEGQKIFTLVNENNLNTDVMSVEVGGVEQFAPENFLKNTDDSGITTIVFYEEIPEGTDVLVSYYGGIDAVNVTLESHVNNEDIHISREDKEKINSLDIEVKNIGDKLSDYEYQLGTIVGRQLHLTRLSGTNRIPFYLTNEFPDGTSISISLDDGVSYTPLLDVEGSAVTTIPKGFGEVVVSGDFFTLVNKGGSLTNVQLQALIDIVNELTANDNDLRQDFISSVISTDASIPLNSDSTWNQILNQIPNIKASFYSIQRETITSSAYQKVFLNATGSNATLPYLTLNTSTLLKQPRFIMVYSSNNNAPYVWYDFNYNNASTTNFSNYNYNGVGYRIPYNNQSLDIPVNNTSTSFNLDIIF